MFFILIGIMSACIFKKKDSNKKAVADKPVVVKSSDLALRSAEWGATPIDMGGATALIISFDYSPVKNSYVKSEVCPKAAEKSAQCQIKEASLSGVTFGNLSPGIWSVKLQYCHKDESDKITCGNTDEKEYIQQKAEDLELQKLMAERDRVQGETNKRVISLVSELEAFMASSEQVKGEHSAELELMRSQIQSLLDYPDNLLPDFINSIEYAMLIESN